MRASEAAQKTKLEQYVHENVELSAKVEVRNACIPFVHDSKVYCTC
jgi:hypothetical protein